MVVFFLRRPCPRQADAVGRIEIKPRPFGALERPFVLGALDEAVDVAHLQLHRRLLVPAIVLAVQEMIEEAQLQVPAVVGIKMRPVLDAVRFEPLVLRRGADKTFEIAARMQRLAAPIGRRQKRHLDLRPHRRTGAMIGVVERMGQNIAAEIAAVLRQFLVRQSLRPAHQFAVHAAALAAFAGAVLHGLDLHVVPVVPERAEDAAVVRHVAIPVGGAFPDAHGGEMRRLERRHVPLVDAVVGNAVEPDLAARPRLHARPFDAVVKILGLARREMIDHAGRAAGATGIDAHAGVIVRHPFLRIDHFPALVEI